MALPPRPSALHGFSVCNPRPPPPQACFSRPPSVVVSCAGITRDEFLLHMSEDNWDKVIAVNLKVVVTSELVTSGSSSLGRELEDRHPN